MQSIVLGSIAFSSAQTSPSPVLCGWEIFQPLITRVAEGFAEFCNDIVVKTGEDISAINDTERTVFFFIVIVFLSLLPDILG
jgi:hypothetical protein